MLVLYSPHRLGTWFGGGARRCSCVVQNDEVHGTREAAGHPGWILRSPLASVYHVITKTFAQADWLTWKWIRNISFKEDVSYVIKQQDLLQRGYLLWYEKPIFVAEKMSLLLSSSKICNREDVTDGIMVLFKFNCCDELNVVMLDNALNTS